MFLAKSLKYKLVQNSISFIISLWYAKITEFNLSAFIYRLFHEDISPIVGTNLGGNSTISMPYTQTFGVYETFL